MSLRSVHLLFILLAILGADLFGIWAVWFWLQSHDGMILATGIVALLGGLGLLGYAIRTVRRFDHAHIR